MAAGSPRLLAGSVCFEHFCLVESRSHNVVLAEVDQHERLGSVLRLSGSGRKRDVERSGKVAHNPAGEPLAVEPTGDRR